ncbi:MAG: IS110 family transposase [Thermoleophilia bacterium]
MTSIAESGSPRRVAIGIDTHKFIHVAVALDEFGTFLDDIAVSVDQGGYARLLTWATSQGPVIAFGIEGTGSYGVALTSFLRRHGHTIIEVARPDRRDRRLRGKSDVLDAENAARAVLAGKATAVPKSADGTVEMLRQIKVAKDTAVKARTSAMITLKALVVTAPPELGQELRDLSKTVLIERCLALRPGKVETPLGAAKHVLRSLARRWRDLSTEIKEHEVLLAQLTKEIAPQLVDAFGIGPDTAAEVLIVAGDNPQRIRSEAAWARLCGVAPIPASSGTTTRHRLNRGGHRQANAALYRTIIVRMQHHEPTRAYVARRTEEGRTKKEIIRCLKRFLAREIWALMRPLREGSNALPKAT